jgi:hypothetical protein
MQKFPLLVEFWGYIALLRSIALLHSIALLRSIVYKKSFLKILA